MKRRQNNSFDVSYWSVTAIEFQNFSDFGFIKRDSAKCSKRRALI
jgi:hypothetical protein